MKINYMKTNELAKEPYRGSKDAAGYDLFAASYDDIQIAPHCTRMIDTGIAVELPEGTFGAVFARSGLASKRGLRPGNCVGVIDSDYRGNIMVALHNDTDNFQSVAPQEKIAQLVLMPYITMEFNETEELSETFRNEGGFGSTGRM